MSTSKISEHACTLVLELLTPLHIGSGEPDGGSDAGVIRDFNGLPGIPGTSIQGMLRAAVEQAKGKAVAECIFGHSSTANRGTGRGGRLTVTWGVLHTSRNQPVNGRITVACRDSDEVLRDAARPMLRDHVKLGPRGVAEKHGKFDELVVSAGHRFTVKLWFVTAERDPADAKSGRAPVEADSPDDWKILEEVLRTPGLRIGGKTRRGLGALKINEWSENGVSRSLATGPAVLDESLSCDLTPETLWMFGGGTSESADSAPVSGTRIVWDAAGQGTVQPVWILPGSGIKGAIRHRTMFHANRLAGNFADKPDKPAGDKAMGWMNELFGFIQGKEGKPGRVFIDDVFIPKADSHLAGVQDHVSINPFTSGAKDSALFNDEPLKPGIATVRLKVQVREVSAKAKEAFKAALDDLSAGRLAIGAHAGRGYGVFKQPGAAHPQPAQTKAA